MAKKLGTGAKFYLKSAEGQFVELRPLDIQLPAYEPVTFIEAKPGTRVRIECLPTPGRHGIEYVPDWYRLTHFG